MRSCLESGTYVLTFDDGPSDVYVARNCRRALVCVCHLGACRSTAQLLDILSANNVQAAFFVVGNRVPRYSDVLQRARNEGHFIAHHSNSHVDLNALSLAGVRREMNDGEANIASAGCVHPRVMRPPYGRIAGSALDLVQDMGYMVVNWNLDTNDWQLSQGAPATTVYNMVATTMSDEFPGSIIHLQHDLLQSSVDTVANIIDMVRTKGYKLVSLPECLYGPSAHASK